MHWTNYDNIDFFNEVSPEELKKIAKTAGLETCCDLEMIMPYLQHDSAILEVGAGYGRVLKCLLKHGFTNLTAIERSKQFYELLVKSFGSKVKLYNEDLHQFKTDVKFDYILWLWSGIADFAKSEQREILQLLLSFLKPGGKMFVDITCPFVELINSTYFNGQECEVEVAGNKVMLFCALPEEIAAASNNICSNTTQLYYFTKTKRKRVLNILSR